jgi:hypothetical protein
LILPHKIGKKSKKSIDKAFEICYNDKKVIEAHLNKSIRRGKACASVAAEKGFGAEGRLGVRRSWHCGKYPLCCRRSAESYRNPEYSRPFWMDKGQRYAFRVPLPLFIKNSERI